MTAWTVTPVLGCRDVRRSAEWFRDTLGFHLDPENGLFEPAGEGAVYAILDREGARLHLQIRRGPEPPGDRESIETDVYFVVDDADALSASYEAAGVAIVRPILDSSYGLRDFCIETPDGHRLVFGTPVGS